MKLTNRLVNELTPEVLEALKDTVDYLWEPELDSYQEVYEEGNEVDGHQFENLVKLNNYLHGKDELASDYLDKD